MRVKRNEPITKQLSEKYGGTWKHIPFHSMWFCDELGLNAHYVFEGGYDVNGCPMEEHPLLRSMKGLHVYGLKSGPEKFYPNK